MPSLAIKPSMIASACKVTRRVSDGAVPAGAARWAAANAASLLFWAAVRNAP
jgi:hypothetical protein